MLFFLAATSLSPRGRSVGHTCGALVARLTDAMTGVRLGGIPTLAERVAGAWARGPDFAAAAAAREKRAADAAAAAAAKKRRTDAAGAMAHGSGISVAPTALAIARCDRCEEPFKLLENHHGACFGHHSAMLGGPVQCERVAKVNGLSDAGTTRPFNLTNPTPRVPSSVFVCVRVSGTLVCLC